MDNAWMMIVRRGRKIKIILFFYFLESVLMYQQFVTLTCLSSEGRRMDMDLIRSTIEAEYELKVFLVSRSDDEIVCLVDVHTGRNFNRLDILVTYGLEVHGLLFKCSATS